MARGVDLFRCRNRLLGAISYSLDSAARPPQGVLASRRVCKQISAQQRGASVPSLGHGRTQLDSGGTGGGTADGTGKCWEPRRHARTSASSSPSFMARLMAGAGVTQPGRLLLGDSESKFRGFVDRNSGLFAGHRHSCSPQRQSTPGRKHSLNRPSERTLTAPGELRVRRLKGTSHADA